MIRKSNLLTYHTPRPVLLQIESALEKIVEQQPDAAVTLTNALWEASFYEAHLLSAFLLGTIPPASAVAILTRLPEKLYETKDKGIKDALLTSALARLRKENPQALMKLISEWLNAPGPNTQTWGLQAFIPLMQQLGYDDLPQIFKILQPAIETISPSTQLDIQACINALYPISPVETIHYLTEIIRETRNPQVIRIFLRLLKGFPLELQKELSTIIKSKTFPISERN
jgi:hypothetical protein